LWELWELWEFYELSVERKGKKEIGSVNVSVSVSRVPNIENKKS